MAIPTARMLMAAATLLTTVTIVHANEGMWLFTNIPTKRLQNEFGFAPDGKWLEHVQKSSVRFDSGGSGSFVSADGLVMTNHHVGSDSIYKLSEGGKDLLKEGFHATKYADELQCKDLILHVLMTVENVTDRVNAAVKADMPPADAALARRKIIAEIEKESKDKTQLESKVTTLYQGGEYHLYRFKEYKDVRLVFAPEQQIAFFGGDPDNFEFPRYDLDVCFFRAYEDGKPAKVEHYLKWSQNGSKENELIFVSGHPGRTNRSFTVAELEYLRDRQYPATLQRLNRLEVLLKSWSDRSQENARRAKDDLFSIQNSRKARIGGLSGLMDPKTMGRKIADEKNIREMVAADPKLKDAAGAWDVIAKAITKQKEIAKEQNMLEGAQAFNSHLFGFARTLLRGGVERGKPNGDRLPEFRETNLDTVKFKLLTKEEIYDDFELLKLADSLAFCAEQMGYDHPITQKILAGKSPRDRAREVLLGTKLKDPAVREKLWEGGKAAVDQAGDPMIALAASIDAEARALRKTLEAEVTEVKQQAYAKIAKAKYAIDGANVYPDATFTLRLAFGTVKGYEEDGKHVAPFTDYAGLYARSAEHKNREPFNLPERWVERKAKLNLKTPFNFVSTADIIGGNSGSPVINQKGEVVGLIFDGNIQSLVLDMIFDEYQARALSVDSRAIVEALRKLYDAGPLADELTGMKR